MIVRIDKTFHKDVGKITDAKVKEAIAEIIKALLSTDELSEVNNLKKLVGYKNLYRIRLGNYRIGLEQTPEQELILIRFLHRKDIYQKWP